MAEISAAEALNAMIDVLREAFEGPREQWSYFTDNEPSAGLIGTLRKIDAARASKVIGTESVASHTFHLVFSLEASAAWIRGDRTSRDWNSSWNMRTVDEAQWAGLRIQLETGYIDLRAAAVRQGLTSAEAFGGAAAALAHAAFHLGVIRQKLDIGG